jgi:hypothetical protein
MTVIIKTIPRTSAKQYFANGKRISLKDALRILEHPETLIIYK